jgi:hypothetical protein
MRRDRHGPGRPIATPVEQAVGDLQKVEAPAGEESVGTLLLFAGTHTSNCDVPGHREAGMEATITVSAEGEVPDDPGTAFETIGSQ